MKYNYLQLAITFFLGVVIVSSCQNKSQMKPIDEGHYIGMFTVVSSDTMSAGEVEILFEDNMYTCSGNKSRIPAGGSGVFESENGTIIFYDENMWTSDFDWNLILKGTYTYSVKGKRLILERSDDTGDTYMYTLKRMRR